MLGEGGGTDATSTISQDLWAAAPSYQHIQLSQTHPAVSPAKY